MRRHSSSISSSEKDRRLAASLVRHGVIVGWTALWLVFIDLAVGLYSRYPDSAVDANVDSVQRYFNYGRSVEDKVRWMVGPTDGQSAPLA